MADISWLEEEFNGDPYQLNVIQHPALMFTNLSKTGEKTVDKIDFIWPDITSSYHKHHRWTGNFYFPIKGIYTFTFTTDDGMRFFINQNEIKPRYPSNNAWIIQPPTTYTVDVALDVGTQNIVVEHFNVGGGAQATFSWELKVSQESGGGTIFTPNANPVEDLTSFIQIKPDTTIEKSYTKGTLENFQPLILSVINTSNTRTLSVGFSDVSGVSFSPSQLILSPSSQQSVLVRFDSSILETYPSGIQTLLCDVSISDASQK